MRDESSEPRLFKIGPWITSPPNTPNPTCRFHDGLCCFADDDLDRCPLCHSTWETILRSDRHSCERSSTWGSPDRKERVELARNLRAEAVRDRDHSVRTLEVDAETTEDTRTAWSPSIEVA